MRTYLGFRAARLWLASYRDAFTTSEAKDVPIDALLLMEMIRLHRDKFQPWIPDDPLAYAQL
jgi:hypothetical protein